MPVYKKPRFLKAKALSPPHRSPTIDVICRERGAHLPVGERLQRGIPHAPSPRPHRTTPRVCASAQAGCRPPGAGASPSPSQRVARSVCHKRRGHGARRDSLSSARKPDGNGQGGAPAGDGPSGWGERGEAPGGVRPTATPRPSDWSSDVPPASTRAVRAVPASQTAGPYIRAASHPPHLSEENICSFSLFPFYQRRAAKSSQNRTNVSQELRPLFVQMDGRRGQQKAPSSRKGPCGIGTKAQPITWMRPCGSAYASPITPPSSSAT